MFSDVLLSIENDPQIILTITLAIIAILVILIRVLIRPKKRKSSD